MFKFIRKKLLEGMIKDVIANLPKYKELAKLQFEEHKDEILAKIQEKIRELVKKVIEEKIAVFSNANKE